MPFKKDIEFLDLEGNKVKDTFWFGLNKAEVAKLHLGVKGGSLEDLIKKIIAEVDGEKIIEHFERILMMAIGERNPNGRSFDKSEDIRSNFKNSDAYSELFVELLQNPTYAAEFLKNLMPANYVEKANEIDEANKKLSEAAGKGADTLVGAAQTRSMLTSVAPVEPIVATSAKPDLGSMSREELQAALLQYQKDNSAE